MGMKGPSYDDGGNMHGQPTFDYLEKSDQAAELEAQNNNDSFSTQEEGGPSLASVTKGEINEASDKLDSGVIEVALNYFNRGRIHKAREIIAREMEAYETRTEGEIRAWSDTGDKFVPQAWSEGGKKR